MTTPCWRYQDLAGNSDSYDVADPRAQLGYDDSAWPFGSSPWSSFAADIGNGWEPAAPGGGGTLWGELRTIWLRGKAITSPGVALTLTVRLDNAAVVWWNGTRVYERISTLSEENSFTIPAGSVTGSDLVAVRAWDRGGGGTNQGYIDLFPLTLEPCDLTVVRQWPRDDARGLGAGERIVPPPRVQRIVGGQQ